MFFRKRGRWLELDCKSIPLWWHDGTVKDGLELEEADRNSLEIMEALNYSNDG